MMLSEKLARLAGGVLAIGAVLTVAGEVGAVAIGAREDYANPAGVPLGLLQILGAILCSLTLSVVLSRQVSHAPVLTSLGYAGVLFAILIFNVGDGFIQTFALPYMAAHGLTIEGPPPGLGIVFLLALVLSLIGEIAMGAAIIRARVYPRWIGALPLAAALVSIIGMLPVPRLTGVLGTLDLDLAFAGLAAMGLIAARVPGVSPRFGQSPAVAARQPTIASH